MDEILRRRILDKCTSVELAIYEAITEVEKLPTDEKLTDVVLKLEEAQNLVADFINEHPGVAERQQEWKYTHDIKQKCESLLQAYKDGFDSATACLISANKMMQERKLQI